MQTISAYAWSDRANNQGWSEAGGTARSEDGFVHCTLMRCYGLPGRKEST